MTNLSASNKILFCQRAFALWGNLGSLHTLHTFANRTCLLANQNLQKSAILPTHLFIMLFEISIKIFTFKVSFITIVTNYLAHRLKYTNNHKVYMKPSITDKNKFIW